MSDSGRREVRVERISTGRYRATNPRGGTLSTGTGEDADFTPVELLLTALAACSAVDVDLITSRRAEPEAFSVEAAGEKVRDEHGNHLTDLALDYDITFPEGTAGDDARAELPRSVTRSHDRLCTVSRTVELGTPVSTRIT
ncbi:MAG: OsmC family protein [Streptosporangiales bacterium]